MMRTAHALGRTRMACPRESGAAFGDHWIVPTANRGEIEMPARNMNGRFSICRFEFQRNSDCVNYFTLRWGFNTEEDAIKQLGKVAAEEAIDVSDLVVVAATFAIDLNTSNI